MIARLSTVVLSVLALVSTIAGCTIFAPKNGQYQDISAPYDMTIINKSLALDILPKIQRSDAQLGPVLSGTELLSESSNTIASLGQSEDGSRTWFNMVSFGDSGFTARRKYFFEVNDKEAGFASKPNKGMRFDCELILDSQILNGSYTSQSDRQIAILKYIQERLRADIAKFDSRTDASGRNNVLLSVSGMLINQTFDTILRQFSSIPFQASMLTREPGVEFDHINFNKGTIRLTIENNIAILKIRIGNFLKSP